MSEHSSTLLTVKDAAHRLSLSEASIYDMVRSGRLSAVRLGRRGGAIRIRPEDLEQCLQASTHQVTTKSPHVQHVPRVKLKHIRLR